MTKTVLGDELMAPLNKIKWILKDLKPIQQQQVIEMMMVTYLFHHGSKRAAQRMMMEGMARHVWQLLDQVEEMEP